MQHFGCNAIFHAFLNNGCDLKFMNGKFDVDKEQIKIMCVKLTLQFSAGEERSFNL